MFENNFFNSLEEKLCNIATINKQPIGGSLELLPLCNMNCDMCYVRLRPEEAERKGGICSGKRWLTLAEEMKRNGVLFLLLTGGEPFLHPNFQEIYLGLFQRGMILSINTNGTLITEELAAFLGKYRPRRVNVTLYGGTNETYAKLCHNPNGLTQTLNGIRLLQKYNIDVKLNGSLVRGNCKDLDEIICISRDLGLYLKIDTYMYPATRERDGGFCDASRLSAQDAACFDIEIHRKQLNDNEFQRYCQEILTLSDIASDRNELLITCRAGRSSFMINWQGRMQPCAMVSTPSIDVFENGFEKAWNQLSKEAANVRLSTSCASCKRRNLCQVCMGSTISETGKVDGVPTYLCEYTEEQIRIIKNMEHNGMRKGSVN